MERIEKQIREQYQKAFNDVLTQSLTGDNTDWDWLVRLYSELRENLCQLTPNRKDIHTVIRDSMDVDIFSQMIRNEVFKPKDMWELVTYVFGLIKEREAAARNKMTDQVLQKLYSDFTKEGATIATFVPQFLHQAHARINLINEDKAKFLAQFKKG